jgi:hypothetical protein
MASNSGQLSGQSGADTPQKIKDIFKRCLSLQQRLGRLTSQELRDFFSRELLFADPLFPPAPKLDRVDLLIWEGQLYEALVKLLKTAANDDSFWYVLAQWLRSEGIRQPGDFLPPGIFRRLASGAGFSGADIRNTYAVRIWLPYTEPFVRKVKWLRQQNEKDLRKRLLELGYDSTAVDLVIQGGTRDQKSWHSAVEFTCSWIASRTLGTETEYERETLVNSYSRFIGTRRLRLSKCSFCEKPAEKEFWACGDPILHCRKHGADDLPITENSARTDRFGRRWWREDSEIRCTTPAV